MTTTAMKEIDNIGGIDNYLLFFDPKNMEAHSFHALALGVIKFYFLAAIFHFQFHFSFFSYYYFFFSVISILYIPSEIQVRFFFNFVFLMVIRQILFSRRRDRRSSAERQAVKGDI
jgi:hypothetical protein